MFFIEGICIFDRLIKGQQAEDQHEQFIPVFKAGHHLRVDRVGQEEQGDDKG